MIIELLFGLGIGLMIGVIIYYFIEKHRENKEIEEAIKSLNDIY